ncbi:uncharacterized protein LOC127718481 [Mytilus californianus]|uniref:uncharacterized protein LOC127718481 n=1 Tax=Mytilus californianus TaxID=6549 RepID=UPI002245E9EB|nr:uncharacterized protein LOC127718481 [Mytilus californianus]
MEIFLYYMKLLFVDDIVPIEIKLMSNKKSIPLYLKLLESGSEKKRDIRLVIVGKKGTGKTSLCKRLFEEEVSKEEVKSTNGIEIHRIKCNANYDDGIWYKLNANNQETELNARLLKPYEETLVDQGKGTNKASVTMSVEAEVSKTFMNASATSLDESEETASLQPEKPKPPLITNCDIKPHVASEPHVKPSDATKVQVKSSITTEPLDVPFDTDIYHKHQPNLSLKQAHRDVENMLKSEVNLHDKEEYATLLLWDFAGDEEFYHIHQTFLSPDAIYIVVTKLNEAFDKEAQDLFRLWMDSIHCYGRIEEEKNKYDDNMTFLDDLDPSVVIVGTWKDACTSESADAYMVEDACRENLLAYTRNMADDERGHIRDKFFISNTEDDNSVFQKIRQDILKLAKKKTEHGIKNIR